MFSNQRHPRLIIIILCVLLFVLSCEAKDRKCVLMPYEHTVSAIPLLGKIRLIAMNDTVNKASVQNFQIKMP